LNYENINSRYRGIQSGYISKNQSMLSGNYRTSTKSKTTNFGFTPFNIQQFILYFVNAQGTYYCTYY